MDPLSRSPRKNERRPVGRLRFVRRQLVARGPSGLIADLREALRLNSTRTSNPANWTDCQELVSVSRLYEDSTWPRPLAFVEAIEGHRQGNQKSSARVPLDDDPRVKGSWIR